MKPFLKWAGGKFRLMERILAGLPPGKRLVEPFAGSGAVFLNTSYPAYALSDTNADLIHLYRHLQAEGADFIAFAQAFFTPDNNTREMYLALRARFNASADTRERAALFIYLNRHGFNGLCRYNAGGGFNVPFGRYARPPFPGEAMRGFHAKSHAATFSAADFREVMESATAGDVVYCDPPYVPLSATSNFTSYATGGFGMDEQLALADMARRLQSRGIPVVISNHDTPWTRENYRPARLVAFDVQRFISADTGNRGKAGELLAVFS